MMFIGRADFQWVSIALSGSFNGTMLGAHCHLLETSCLILPSMKRWPHPRGLFQLDRIQKMVAYSGDKAVMGRLGKAWKHVLAANEIEQYPESIADIAWLQLGHRLMPLDLQSRLHKPGWLNGRGEFLSFSHAAACW